MYIYRNLFFNYLKSSYNINMAEIEVNIIDDKPIEAEIELPIPVPLSFSRPLLLLVCALFVAALTEG
jgi:hypothetical protein